MTHENYDPSFPDQPVVDLYLPIWAQLPAFRHKPAFIWAEDGPPGPAPLTYEQLNSAVHSISSQLSLSLHKGDTVVILCEPGLGLVEIIFACQRAGLVAVPVTPPPLLGFSHDHDHDHHHHHHLVRVLSQTNPKAALATRGFIHRATEYSSSTTTRLSKLLENVKWIATDDLKAKNENTNTITTYDGCRANEVYLIQYTSGATGIPKPVAVTAGAAAHNVRAARRSYDLHPNSMIVSWLPQYHDCGFMFLLLTVISGATCVLTSPNAFVTRPRVWLELITEFKATCTPVPSFALPLVVRRGGVEEGTSCINLSTMKNLIIVNEPIYKSSIEEFVRAFGPFGLDSSSISPSYGLAENCTFVSTAWRSGAAAFPVHKNLMPSAKLPTKREEFIEEDIEILVVNEVNHEAVDDGVEGEIWISSPSAAVGYLDHPSRTREVFNGRLRGKVSGRYLRSGDRGVVAGEGRYLYVTGRCADVIRCGGGVEIQAHYVETAAYGGSRGVVRAGCIAAFEHGGAVAVVAEVREGTKEVGRRELEGMCEGIRAAVWREERVEVGVVVVGERGSVPKTTSGKIRRWAARCSFERGELKGVVRMEFGEDGGKSTVFRAREEVNVHGRKERERKEVGARNSGNRLTLISSL